MIEKKLGKSKRILAPAFALAAAALSDVVLVVLAALLSMLESPQDWRTNEIKAKKMTGVISIFFLR